tara:strand:+ start:57010 stop:58761 length:1752 start_codon:yes stop_codon:yes gene_type:complete
MKYFNLCTILLSACSVCTAVASADSRPNIIIVMPDDMGYGDLGATGNPIIRTPNLDRFAKESSHLTNFYVSPVCSPTRACLMTGRYNYRTRVIDTFKGRSMMDPAEVTIAEVLGEAGYATGIFGKWHLGDNYPMRPQDQGFDEVLIHRGGGLAQPSEPIENKKRYTDPILFRNGEQVQTQGYCTDIYFDAAIEFMESSRESGKPFFVYLPPNAPHAPYHDVPEELLAYYKSVNLDPVMGKKKDDASRDTVARVYAMVENIDQNFGKLEQYLNTSGQRENTFVVFLTDNGPNTNRYVGPFREMKSWVHEGGIHTVFVARWPAGIKQKTKSTQIAAHIDLMPTVLAVAGVNPPEYLLLDGRNALPLLDGTQDVDWADRTLFLQTHRGDRPVEFHHFAARGPHWKLVHPTGFGKESITKDVPYELYQVNEDRGESKNLASQHPEKVDELKSRYQAWFKDVSSTRDNNYAPPRIVIGSDSETTSDLSIQDWRVDDAQGWGSGGTWKVDIIDAGPYDASVRWENPIGSREIVLHVGDKSFRGTLASDSTQATFADITLPLGKVDVFVDVSGKPRSRGEVLRFVTLTRK